MNSFPSEVKSPEETVEKKECDEAWYQYKKMTEAYREILALHPDIEPSLSLDNITTLEVYREFTVDDTWELEKQGDTTFTAVGYDAEREDNLVDCRIFDREGETVEDFIAHYDRENDGLFFGVPISYQRGAKYSRNENQIIIGDVPDGVGNTYEVHEVDGVVMSDHLDPTLEKEAYVVHIGAIPYSILYDENKHYESYLVRNMRTQERHFFAFPIEPNSYMNGTPFILRGEFYFVVTTINTTRVIHARSHEPVYTWERVIDNIFTPCTDFAVFSYENCGRTTFVILA